MKQQKAYIFILFLFCFCLNSQAQFKGEQVNIANELYDQHKYYEALTIYIDFLKENPSQHELMYRTGNLCEKYGDYELAINYYTELIKNHQYTYPDLGFKCAQIYKTQGKYAEAIKEFEKFNKLYVGLDKSYFNRIIKTEIEGCNLAIQALQNDAIQIGSMSEINSTYTDLSPFIFEGKLYFTTIPSDSTLKYGDIKEPNNFLKIHCSTKDSNGIWGKPIQFIPQVLNEVNKHSVGGAFSLDGKRFYFSRCSESVEGINNCKIYVTQLKDSAWTAAVELTGGINDVNNIFSSSHVSLSTNLKTKKDILYFSSNMLGGKGGYDLWETEVEDNFNCKNIKNLGTKINTEKDEITPFYYSKTSTLYFSSNGQIGFGGYDVYGTVLAGKKLGKIKHLESPINTNLDEFYYTASNSSDAYFVSNRTGTKKYYKDYVLDDIFKVNQIVKKFIIVKTFEKDSAQKEILNSSITIKNINTSEVKNVKTNDVIEVLTNSSFLINSIVSSHINGTKEFKFSPDLEDDTITVSLFLEKVIANKEITLKNIYFDFNSDSLKAESKFELDTLNQILVDNPNFTIEIGAHTDDVGKSDYNLTLSQKRAQSVVNYLIAKGINQNRLIAQGYGLTKPIAPNKNEDGTDNPEGRQLNRRIVFKIVGTEISSKQ